MTDKKVLIDDLVLASTLTFLLGEIFVGFLIFADGVVVDFDFDRSTRLRQRIVIAKKHQIYII